MLKRVAILGLAAWILFSGSVWPHSQASRFNNAVVGAGLLFFGALSIRREWARYVTLALGIWLFAFTALTSRANPITFWNDAMVALAVSILSLVGGESPRRALEPPGQPSH